MDRTEKLKSLHIDTSILLRCIQLLTITFCNSIYLFKKKTLSKQRSKIFRRIT